MSLVSFYTPENIRKPLVFLCFQRVQKETSGMKSVKNKLLAMPQYCFCCLTDTYIRLCQAFMLKLFAKTVNYFRKDFY